MKSAYLTRSPARMSFVFDHVGAWLLVILVAGTFNETQNLGSQAFIFAWPVCLRIFLGLRRLVDRPAVLVIALTLLAATTLPPVVNTGERAARAVVGSARNVPLASHNLKNLGAVTSRPEVAQRAEHLMDFYPAHRATFRDMVTTGDEVTPLLYSDNDFQIAYLAHVDHAVDAIRQLEADRGIHFGTILSINNYNPFPWLMGRSAPRGMAIAADPLRTVAALDAERVAAIASTDLVLYPTCPPTVMSAKLLALYAPGLTHHRRIKLDDCYDAFVSAEFSSAVDGVSGVSTPPS